MFRDGWSGVLELERGEALRGSEGLGWLDRGEAMNIINFSDDYALILVQLL